MLDDLGVADLHIAEADWEDAPDMPAAFREALRLVYRGMLIYAGKYTLERAERALRNGWPLATPDASRFFGGEAAGYTDYPIFAAQKARIPAMAQEWQ